MAAAEGTEYVGLGAAATRLDRDEEDYAAVSGRDIFIPAPPPAATALVVEYARKAGRLQLRPSAADT